MKKFKYSITLLVITLFGSSIASQQKTLQQVVLKGKDGGTASGEEWNSRKYKGKINLMLYVVPQKKNEVMPLINKIDSLKYPPEVLRVTFIVNTRATSIPDFVIKNMIKKRAESNRNILYVLDQNQVLVHEWELKNDDINVLITDSSGCVWHNYYGKITDKYIEDLIRQIHERLK